MFPRIKESARQDSSKTLRDVTSVTCDIDEEYLKSQTEAFCLIRILKEKINYTYICIIIYSTHKR